jgi:rubrerythrin
LKGKKLAKIALENRQKADSLYEEMEKIREDTGNERTRLMYDVYRPKIRAIEEERDEACEKVKKTGESVIIEKRETITKLMEPVNQVKRILEFLRLDTKQDLNITDDDVKQYDRYGEKYRENLGLVYDDTYLKVRLFIMENEKPKNKYMLVIIGKCLFDNGLGDRPLLKLPHSYGLNLSSPWGSAPQDILKESSSVKELKAWWKAKGFPNLSFARVQWLNDYLAVKEEYENILANYKLNEFREFLTYKCPACGYFHTIFESYYLRDGEVITCPRDQIAMKDVTKGQI